MKTWLSPQFVTAFFYSFCICTHSSADTLNPNLAGHRASQVTVSYFRAASFFLIAVMLITWFSLPVFGWWWFGVAEQSQCFAPHSLECFMLSGPDHLPRWLWIQEGEPVHHRTRLCSEVQGWIEETVLLDAGERKMLLFFFKGEEMEAIFVKAWHLWYLWAGGWMDGQSKKMKWEAIKWWSEIIIIIYRLLHSWWQAVWLQSLYLSDSHTFNI